MHTKYVEDVKARWEYLPPGESPPPDLEARPLIITLCDEILRLKTEVNTLRSLLITSAESQLTQLAERGAEPGDARHAVYEVLGKLTFLRYRLYDISNSARILLGAPRDSIDRFLQRLIGNPVAQVLSYAYWAMPLRET